MLWQQEIRCHAFKHREILILSQGLVESAKILEMSDDKVF
jgi:hypothetical protein